LIAGILALTIPSLPLSAHAQPGTVLARFTTPMRTAAPEYFPVGSAFDGQNLWYSDPSDSQPDIFQTTTTGTLLRILPKVVGAAGALAWDGTNLWVASFDTRSRFNGRIWQISVGQNPTVLKTIELNDILSADDECALIDGLGFDPSSNTLWFSPDAGCSPHGTVCQVGHVYQVDLSGKLVSRLEFAFAISGDEIVGNNLYIVQRCTSTNTVPHIIYKTTLSGQIISGFPLATLVSGHVTTAEDIGFDPVTFASQGHCALWANERTGIVNPTLALTAYEIDCP
jgi:hypothetical protein